MQLLENDLTEKIIGSCFGVSNELGSGFLEVVYCLIIALLDHGLSAAVQQQLEVIFRGTIVGHFQLDIIVENRVVLEVKNPPGVYFRSMKHN